MSEGVKYDAGKPRMSLLPNGPLVEVAKVMNFGAQKYTAHNWRKGMAWSRLADAALRHIGSWNEGENVDPESGLSHLAHAACCLVFLLELIKTHQELDDRYQKPVAASKSLADLGIYTNQGDASATPLQRGAPSNQNDASLCASTIAANRRAP